MDKTESASIAGSSAEDIMALARNFQKSRVLLTAFELGLFTCLGGKRKSSAEVAAAVKTDARATDRLMNALCALGLLEKSNGLFANTPAAAECLVEGQPRYLANLAHSVNLWDTWSTLTDAVRRGTAVADRPTEERGKQWLEAFIGAMHTFASQRAPEVVGMLDLSGVTRVLDVGGGSGEYAMELVRTRETIRPVVLDRPEVIPFTRKYIEQNGMTDKIDTVMGDFKTDDFGQGYDMVFVSSIIHMISPGENQSLIGKCARALNPNGQLVIKDFIVSEDRTHPADVALFALNMLVATEKGDTYAGSEVCSWMETAGLSRIERKETGFGGTLIIGRRA